MTTHSYNMNFAVWFDEKRNDPPHKRAWRILPEIKKEFYEILEKYKEEGKIDGFV